MRALINSCLLMGLLCITVAKAQDSLPALVEQFRDDSTYYNRILGAKKDIIKPTDDTIDSLITLWDMPYQNYVKILFDGFFLESRGYLDSAKNRYETCLRMEIKNKDIYYTNLDIARVYLKQKNFAKAETYLEKYIDMLFFDFYDQYIFWTGGIQDELIRFLVDQNLSFLRLPVRPEIVPVVSELRQLMDVLTNLKKYNNTYIAIPSNDLLEKSLTEAGEEISGMILNKNSMGLMKYVDKYKWQVTFGKGPNFDFEGVKRELSDSTSTIYCRVFGGDAYKGRSIREFLIEEKGKNFRIKTNIIYEDYMPWPLGTLIYEWDEKPDFLYITDFPNPYFLYTKDGWKILSLFTK